VEQFRLTLTASPQEVWHLRAPRADRSAEAVRLTRPEVVLQQEGETTAILSATRGVYRFDERYLEMTGEVVLRRVRQGQVLRTNFLSWSLYTQNARPGPPRDAPGRSHRPGPDGEFVGGAIAISFRGGVSFALVLALATCLGTPVRADRSIEFESDRLQIYHRRGRAVLTGHVRVWNDTAVLRSNRLEIYYVTGTDTVDHMVAFGDVQLRSEELRARADYAFQDVESDTVLLQENAGVRRGSDEFFADRMVVNLRTRAVRMHRRTRGRFHAEEGLLGGGR